MNRRHEHGGASVELALLTPLLVLIALLAVLAYRVVAAESTADAVAHAAARAATLQRTAEGANAAAHDAAANALRTHGLSCTTHILDLDTSGLEPGSTVSANLTCRADLADLSGLGVPGTYEAQGTATAVVDVYRGQP
ncbi:Flp pilus assembly protein TadG [Spinactinospora alkalitolerans]|uniref:Flp pilus assembly protein TadG n=1 Tax=Spinactinospora alkalitolerans TaxID=687207 RepID=A0A852U1M0_9ACTN|nr:TadE/TadG family type IV pilus assembly protein [Spinactinospora alkalitolerans]NYE50021.1 Flp pilus assembly protein TadG [Spinactinospora alkalitolerans]